MSDYNVLKDKTILLTGANGIIELYLIWKLLQIHIPVRIIGMDRAVNTGKSMEKDYYRKQIIRSVSEYPDSQCKFIDADVSDKTVTEMLFQIYQPDIVIHLGAWNTGLNKFYGQVYFGKAAYDGFLNLLEACRHSQSNERHKVSYFIYASDFYEPEDSRRNNEIKAGAYSRLYRMPAVGLRLDGCNELSDRTDFPELITESVLHVMRDPSAGSGTAFHSVYKIGDI